ncbi:ubiquitin elongating factor core-domain-containing protein, partial [Lophiotrema nucula]
IRAKRLAKLGGTPAAPRPSSSAASPSPSTPTKPEDSQPQQPSEPTPAPQPSEAKQNPFSQLGMAAEKQPGPRINIKPKSAAASNGTNQPARSQEQSIETWEDRTLSSIFRITLDLSNTRDVHGHQLYYLSGVKSDLEDDGRPIRLNPDVLDQALIEVASSKAFGKPLDYFLACWKRVSRTLRGMHTKNDPKYAIVKEARRLCFSYCTFAATVPDMFGDEAADGSSSLADHLLVDPENDSGICHDFLSEAVSRFEEDESVKDMLVGAVEQLSQRLAKMSMNDDYKPYILFLRNFVRYQPLLVAMAQSPLFMPEGLEAQHVETRTLLGPFFRLSPMQGEVALNYFSSAANRDKGVIANSQNALRMTLRTHQDELFDITNCFIKTKDSREKILDWFALTVNANHKRRAMRVDPKQVSSDGFMLNVTVILDRLCDPFMDATFSKVDRIDINYLRRSPRVSIEDETKINADDNIAKDFYSANADGTNNFITEVFFLTVAAHHYGTEATNTKVSELKKDVNWLEKQLTKMELERHKFAQNPAQLAVFEAHVKRVKDQIERGHCTILATQGVLLDEVSQARSMQFMRYVIVWLLRLVSPQSDFPKRQVQLPLPDEQPKAFSCLPEYFLEDIVDNFKYITRYMPHIITSTQCEELVMICIVFLRSSEYIKNPYLKAGLVTILFHGVWPVGHRSKGILGDVLFAHSFATKHLLHAVMKFYIECESTGAHTQFYDKFNIRYEVFQVIKCIWPNPVYRENLGTEAKVNTNFFVQFVNLLLNDVTFVLDESFTAFIQIHDISKLLKTPPDDWTPDIRTENEEKLSAAKGKAKSYMQLTNETVSMLGLFTEALSDSFTMPEVVVRLAHMLDYNLEALVGPKKSNLKVETPEEYKWNPRQMLAEISDVYLNLMEKPRFINAIATDGRSYRKEYFETAYNILSRFALKSPEQLDQWKLLGGRVEVAKVEADAEESAFEDAPEEFTDPLMATLMEDPVMLPISKQILDRSTIQSHLLSDPHDPFNRTDLKIEDVVALPELRERIEAWKVEKKAARVAELTGQTDAAGGDPMDTS